MTKTAIYLVSFLYLLLVASCKPGVNSRSHAANHSVSPIPQEAVNRQGEMFPFPEIPATLTELEARRAYLLTHYWELFDFADTTLVNNRDVTEQGFVNFIALLNEGGVTKRLARESLENWCGGFMTEVHARKVLMRMADDYLYNPNSPFYNEASYRLYLEALLNKLPAEDVRRSTFDFRLKLLKRNNVGQKATDFVYYLPGGERRTLADTSVKNDRLLLVFYDPECESCHAVLGQMAADGRLAAAVRNGRLSVLAVYTEGNEAAWRKSLPDMPAGWMVGTDREAVKNGALYDLKAMPSLYLLDGKKTVLLKDARFENVMELLER